MDNLKDPHFQFAPDILSRLGEELVPHADQGLLELAKNSYDADATNFTIKLRNAHQVGGNILISDTGLGMTESEIRNGWLILGSSKKKGQLTKIYKRTPVGDKGLGRLAALRLGNKVILKTRPKAEPGVEYHVTLDWTQFDKARVIESVPIPVGKRESSCGHGTDIEICGLKKGLSGSDLERLSRNLLLMCDPFGGKTSFNVSLSAPEFLKFEEKINNSYFGDAVYHLKAHVDRGGIAQYKVLDWKGELYWKGESTTAYQTVSADFELWVFLLDGKTFSTRKSTVGEVRRWLKNIGGVHIYESGIRVAPYGGAENDWLAMNRMRVESPEERPSTNTTIGRIRVLESDGYLQQKTDRVGYIENEVFSELTRFGQDALKWLADRRLQVAEARRHEEKKKAKEAARKANMELDAALDKEGVTNEGKKNIQKASQNATSAVQKEIKSLRDDLQLYRSLATAGMTSAVFSHEVSHPVSNVVRIIQLLRKKLPNDILKKLNQHIALLEKSKDQLLAYTNLPLKLLRSEKRRAGALDINKQITGISDDYKAVLIYANAQLDLELGTSNPKIIGSVALIEGVFANFFANSVKAFDRGGIPQGSRKILIRTTVDEERVIVSFADSGPGIDGIALNEIWLPGKTTDESDIGTGFGLTIVKDSVKDLGGTIKAKANGELGGAEFIISIPVTE